MKTTLSLAFGFAALPSLAFAHISFVETQAPADTAFKAVLAVPHGCSGGKTTTEIRVTLPEGFIAAKPMPKPGWTLTVTAGDYAKSYVFHGDSVTSGAREIRWAGGALEDDWYDEFTIRGTFSGLAAGTAVAFPVTQVCADGTSVAWAEIAPAGTDPHALAHPAPTVTIAASAGGEHAGHAAGQPMAMSMPGMATLGQLSVTGGFARAMLPGQKVGGAYFTIANAGAADRLVSATTPAASGGDIHEMEMQGDVMKMRALDAGLDIPAGGTVTLAPGGLHVMFTGVATPFAKGDTLPVTLTFEKAGTVELTLPVEAAAAKGPSEDHSGHMMHGTAN